MPDIANDLDQSRPLVSLENSNLIEFLQRAKERRICSLDINLYSSSSRVIELKRTAVKELLFNSEYLGYDKQNDLALSQTQYLGSAYFRPDDEKFISALSLLNLGRFQDRLRKYARECALYCAQEDIATTAKIRYKPEQKLYEIVCSITPEEALLQPRQEPPFLII
ncbi:hypothetical protein HYU21_04820 [Candidatus Woesearchaeota archaeon]|nr:hypothetical protein [Candidatus Woesearchaeota archaeon]